MVSSKEVYKEAVGDDLNTSKIPKETLGTVLDKEEELIEMHESEICHEEDRSKEGWAEGCLSRKGGVEDDIEGPSTRGRQCGNRSCQCELWTYIKR